MVLFVSLEQFATATPGMTPDLHSVGVLFAREALGGIALGAIIGYFGYRMLRSIDNYQVEVLITLALVTGGTALATSLHTSGPLAIVVAGLIIGQQGRQLGMSDLTREYIDKFWEMLDEIMNAILFVLIGFEILVLHFETVYLLVGVCAITIVLIAQIIGRLPAAAHPAVLARSVRAFGEGDDLGRAAGRHLGGPGPVAAPQRGPRAAGGRHLYRGNLLHRGAGADDQFVS